MIVLTSTVIQHTEKHAEIIIIIITLYSASSFTKSDVRLWLPPDQ